jgi:hypothetical protein
VSSELLWAVTDGPVGTNAVQLPEDRSGARLMGAHPGGFWCSGAAGGCGGRLVLHAGDGDRPSFHHHHPLPTAARGAGTPTGGPMPSAGTGTCGTSGP